MKSFLVILLTLILSLPLFAQDVPQSKQSSDKAFLFSLSGLDQLKAEGYRGGIGFRYSFGQTGYWARASFSYNGSYDSDKAQASGGVFKDIWYTTNTTFSLGAELGTNGEKQFFGFGGSLLYMAADNLGISLDELIVLHMEDDYVATSSGGSLTLNIFF